MNHQMKKVMAIGLIILGVLLIITTALNLQIGVEDATTPTANQGTAIVNTGNLQVSVGNTATVSPNQATSPIPLVVTWSLMIVQAFLFVWVVLACQFKKSNLFWLIPLPVGCLVIGTRLLLRLTSNDNEKNDKSINLVAI
jgi:peptidoglycan/LPS O-acetylase OafA/YrhL